MIGCLRKRVRKQPVIALCFEFETVLQLYNLEARYLPSSLLLLFLKVKKVLSSVFPKHCLYFHFPLQLWLLFSLSIEISALDNPFSKLALLYNFMNVYTNVPFYRRAEPAYKRKYLYIHEYLYNKIFVS